MKVREGEMRIENHTSEVYVLKEIGERLADYRIHVPMTQKELSEKTGLSVHTIVNIESGKSVQITNMLKILGALGLMQNLEVLVPPVGLRPSEVFQIGKKRERATSPKYRPKKNPDFVWGDEKGGNRG